jgi:hypothetical protein
MPALCGSEHSGLDVRILAMAACGSRRLPGCSQRWCRIVFSSERDGLRPSGNFTSRSEAPDWPDDLEYREPGPATPSLSCAGAVGAEWSGLSEAYRKVCIVALSCRAFHRGRSSRPCIEAGQRRGCHGQSLRVICGKQAWTSRKPGRTRGGGSGRPDRGRAWYRRQGAAPSSRLGLLLRVGEDAPNRSNCPCASVHKRRCVRYRTYVPALSSYISWSSEGSS